MLAADKTWSVEGEEQTESAVGTAATP